MHLLSCEWYINRGAMELKALVLIAVLVMAGAAADDQTLDGCQRNCGGVPIIYPFGAGHSSTTGKNCFLEESFEVTCNGSALRRGNIPVININLTRGQADMMIFVAQVCYNSSYGSHGTESTEHHFSSLPAFTISSKDNKFLSVGCDTYGYLNSFYTGTTYSTGCSTKCYGNSKRIVDGNCSGIGCCQVDIPPGMRNISVQTYSDENFKHSLSFNNCSYSFVIKNGNYTFSKNHLEYLPFERVPVVFDWTIGNETCEASFNRRANACMGNSSCVDSDTGYGYRCRCIGGYEGNPYHPNGCIDIDECRTGNHNCISNHHCLNTIGSYKCFCPEGQSGNGTREQGCHRKIILTKVLFGVGSSLGSIILFLAIWWFHKVVRKRIAKKQKEKFYKKNGGLLLEQRLSYGEVKAKLFSIKDLEKATDHFNMNRVLGKGGQGTVYKGMLIDGQIVAVKKFKVEGNVDEFINEFVILSQINHRNVVKLLGCCLETEVPLLVYEFIPNGNLFEYLHEQHEDLQMTWDVRLRIATEVAGALFYLHSVASQPIYHRDIKSTNILLDEKYRAKVADFGTSRMVSTEDTHLTTVVQGTFGYLDPEYFHTSRFTEKSDVYSFGVVLVELLTGQRVICSTRAQEDKSLASYLIHSLEENRLFDIIDERFRKDGDKNHIVAMANLASRCLYMNGKNRPTMKEVALELEKIRRLENKSIAQENYEEIELSGIEENNQWAAYSTSNTTSTQNSTIASSS